MIAAEPYKRRIESIVHPISASYQRKNRMRRELWAHFLALAEEEGGDAAACERAWARLGEPKEISRELDATVPKGERSIHSLECFILRPRDENTLRFAGRLAIGFFAFAFIVILLTVVIVAVAATGPQAEKHSFVLAVIVPLYVWVYVLMLIVQPAMRYTEDMMAQSKSRNAVRTALAKSVTGLLCAIAASPVFYLLGYLLLGIAGVSKTKTLEYLYMWPLVVAYAWCMISAAALFGTFRAVQSARAIPDWPYQ